MLLTSDGLLWGLTLFLFPGLVGSYYSILINMLVSFFLLDGGMFIALGFVGRGQMGSKMAGYSFSYSEFVFLL